MAKETEEYENQGSADTPKMDDAALVTYVITCKEEADSAKRDRMDTNRDNYEQYHLRHDFSHKQAGQSKEVLSKVRMAVEQTKAFFVQGLIDVGDWWRCEPADGTNGQGLVITPSEIYKVTNYKMKQAGFYSHVGDGVQASLLGSLWISKVFGCLKTKPRYVARKKGRGKSLTRWLEKVDDKTWHLKYALVRQEDYYPDPTGAKLYEIEECFLDMHIVRALAEEPYGIYDKEAVEDLTPWSTPSSEEEFDKSRETGQNPREGGARPQVKITEFVGNVVDPTTGKLIYENVFITLANETTLIRRPTPNPLWHQRSPIIAAALMEVGNSVWHTALMDAGTKHNRSQTEIYNLMFDAAMQAVHNVAQVRIDDLDDPKQISGGILPGTTLKVRSSLPPGAQVYEKLGTGQIPNDVIQMYQIAGQEGNASMLTSDIRSGGAAAGQTSATAVVEASNTITSVFQGITKNFEMNGMQPILELSWQTVAQNWDLIDKEELVSLFGKERGEQLSQIPAEEMFANTVNGIRFEVFGLSQLLKQQADFRKYTTLLQTLGSSEVLIEAFMQEYGQGFGKLITEIVRTLGIDPSRLRQSPSEEKSVEMPQPPGESAPPAATPGAPSGEMSQIPQAASGSLASALGVESPGQQNFPGSRALANQGGNS